ncbi:MAG: selenide, water dikinase SelD [Paracoccaceae bacterium]
MQAPVPLTRDLVLIGGGHAHALLLRAWGMDPLPGARLTLIDPGPTTAYSGRLPGLIAGHYARDQLDIDLVRLARFAGARHVRARATALDPIARTVAVEGRDPIGFDVASLDVGITSAMPDLPGFASHGHPAKPLGPFATDWQAFRDGPGPHRAAVIGGGVAGAELAMAMANALGPDGAVTLIDRGEALTELGPRAARILRAALRRLHVTLAEHTAVTAIGPRGVETDQGPIAAGFVTGAAGAHPHAWIAATGLATHRGSAVIGPTLQTSDPAIFAVGDCAHMGFDPRPKAGVYAVRQAPVLHHNLRAALSGGRMRRYRPQRGYLKLVSLGGRTAMAERFGTATSGPALWRLKDRIDAKFMARLTDLPDMAAPPPKLAALGAPDRPLCAGCGAKVGAGVLGRALSDLPAWRGDVATPPGDDAAILTSGGATLAWTTDHLRAMDADPVTLARIAVAHALGDVLAMGAAPQAALVSLTLPHMAETLQARTLAELMPAIAHALREAGAQVAGGHTSMGAETSIGLSLTGTLERAPITLAGARAGDALVLTKPLGSGTVMAAAMQGRACGRDIAACLDAMAQAQVAQAARLSRAHAMTDVTGFGLAGHLAAMAEASNLRAVIDAPLPALPGARALAEAGIRSSIWDANRARSGLATGDPLLFDPQTGGGLLAALPRAQAEAAARDLDAWIVGRMEVGQGLALG